MDVKRLLHTEEWEFVKARVEEMIASYRRGLETPSDEQMTNMNRGAIQALRRFLELKAPRED